MKLCRHNHSEKFKKIQKYSKIFNDVIYRQKSTKNVNFSLKISLGWRSPQIYKNKTLSTRHTYLRWLVVTQTIFNKIQKYSRKFKHYFFNTIWWCSVYIMQMCRDKHSKKFKIIQENSIKFKNIQKNSNITFLIRSGGVHYILCKSVETSIQKKSKLFKKIQ